MSVSVAPASPVGSLLREWRHRRRLSQLDLAHLAGVSARHLSFVETGRSAPSREMVALLCEHLDVPLREQNRLLLAAGFAPAVPESDLEAPAMSLVNDAIEHILRGHEPFPALVVDRGWDLVSANDATYRLLADVDPELLEPPVNVIRLSLHRRGLAPHIVNLGQWRAVLHQRLHQEWEHSRDPRLGRLIEDQFGTRPPATPPGGADLVVPLQLRVGGTTLNLMSTTTVFGTPAEVTVSELAIEGFYPADDETRRALLSAGSAT